jgi:hypothetical protein
MRTASFSVFFFNRSCADGAAQWPAVSPATCTTAAHDGARQARGASELARIGVTGGDDVCIHCAPTGVRMVKR